MLTLVRELIFSMFTSVHLKMNKNILFIHLPTISTVQIGTRFMEKKIPVYIYTRRW